MTEWEQRLGQLDRMQVTGIEAWAYHGVFDFERRDGQPFLIDVEWWSDLTAAARSDDLAATIDYSEVADYVLGLVQGEPVNLIETLAQRVREAVLARFPCTYARVSIHKPNAPLAVGFSDVVTTTAIAGPRLDRRPVVFSVGSNIEPRQAYLQFAVTALAATCGIEQVRVSPLFDTVAQGPPQPDFLNAILTAWSDLSAPQLLSRGLQIESLAHRTRQVEHGPRTLDIDLISVGEEVWNTPDLTLPHPRATRRAFVLLPWLVLDPAACLAGQPVRALAESVRGQAVRQMPEQLFVP